MITRSTMSLRQLLVVVALLSGCSESEAPREPSAARAESAGRLILPLRTQVGGNVYRIAGSYRLQRPSQPPLEGTLPFGSRSLRFGDLSPGTYQFELSTFAVWRSANGAAEVDVTARTTLLTPQVSVQVAEGVTRTVTLRFEVEGEPVVVSLCDEEPDAIECPYGDYDGDGYPNIVECDDAAACEDTDSDGTPDVADLDSDNDGYPDDDEYAETDGRTDPCDPDPSTLACEPNPSIEVEAEVEETCEADACTYDGVGPPTRGPVPSELDPSAIALYVYPTYVPAHAGDDFENTIAKDSEVRLQVVHSAGDGELPGIQDIVIEVWSVDALYLAGRNARTPYEAKTEAPGGYDGSFELGGRAVASEALLVISVLHDTDEDGDKEVVARRVVRIEVTPN